jgi:hypothetical protein
MFSAHRGHYEACTSVINTQCRVSTCVRVLTVCENIERLSLLFLGLPKAGRYLYLTTFEAVLASHGPSQVAPGEHREAGRAFTRLLIHELHQPNHIPARPTSRPYRLQRRRPSPTYYHCAELDRPPRLRQPPLHNQHQNGVSQKDLAEGWQPKA